MESLECPAGCGKIFDMPQACNSHVTQAHSCSWYQGFEKYSAHDKALELNAGSIVHDELSNDYMCREGGVDLTAEVAGEMLQELEEENNVCHFVRLEFEPKFGQEGPGPSTQAYQSSLLE
ncbi:hypothetical protein BT96DRAFT_941241 [Gymnopus androsaceus JB14]|uniref:C2H2-type domain-containing protein n=1 Tax=Gymnopus androsaceus JB14 TaxID=1447944 RepID=A0A6A4HJE7_9AGAR|nr:hypothetical protein BT96DRAFT_941241 [Gymnopus androsaceus JB14]